jgi:thiol-disulfide isomerase/thioredoxin
MKYYLPILLLLVLFSCTNENENGLDGSEKLEDNFSITGTILGAENTSFYLEALSQQGVISVAKAQSDSKGEFKMVGNIPGYGLYQLRLGESSDLIIPLTIIPNDDVKIKSTLSQFAISPKISGTSWSNLMTKYMEVYSNFHTEQTALMLLKDSLSNEELTKRFVALKQKVDNFSISAMKKYPSNAFNIVLQGSATPSMGFNDWDPSNLEVLKNVAQAFEKEYPNSPVTTTLSNQVYQIEVAYQTHKMNSSGERPAPEIALKNPNGLEIKLSSLKGKYVLIDFWASWCGPCREENPNVVRLYKKYKSKGFTVYSVSLDDNVTAWQEAISKDGLEWPNHVSDLLKWNSPLPALYEFSGIPHTVLINPEGNIIGVGLRGESLEQKLNEIFSK